MSALKNPDLKTNLTGVGQLTRMSRQRLQQLCCHAATLLGADSVDKADAAINTLRMVVDTLEHNRNEQ